MNEEERKRAMRRSDGAEDERKLREELEACERVVREAQSLRPYVRKRRTEGRRDEEDDNKVVDSEISTPLLDLSSDDLRLVLIESSSSSIPSAPSRSSSSYSSSSSSSLMAERIRERLGTSRRFPQREDAVIQKMTMPVVISSKSVLLFFLLLLTTTN